MLVIEATSALQGARPTDYHFTIDGELAYMQGIECSRPDCGCDRGWAGLVSHSATTTVQVVDRPDLSVEGLASEFAVSLFEGGWIGAPDPANHIVAAFVGEMIECANHFGEGAVLEHEGGEIRTRRVRPLDEAA